MTTTERSMVVAVFETRTQADRAMGELEQAGFAKDQVGYADFSSSAGAVK